MSSGNDVTACLWPNGVMRSLGLGTSVRICLGFFFWVNNTDFDIILPSKCRQKQECLLKNCSKLGMCLSIKFLWGRLYNMRCSRRSLNNSKLFLCIMWLCWTLALKPAGCHPHTPKILVINPYPSFARTCELRITS